jgi:uncharacterized protein YdaU (DUF1376 family)
MNYYPHHIGDYVFATAHLLPMEDLTYRRLLDFYYQTESPIHADTKQVARKIRMEQSLVDLILDEFFTLTEEGWSHGRCDEEIGRYHKSQNQQSEAGRASAAARKVKKDHGINDRSTEFNDRSTPVQRPYHQPEPEPEPNTNQAKSKTIAPASQSLEIFPPEISEQIRSDFMALRKAKKSPVTKTALAGIEREAIKAGVSLQVALELCCQRGWSGFKAEWVIGEQQQARASPRPEKFDPVEFVNRGRKTAGGGNDGFVDSTAQRVA